MPWGLLVSTQALWESKVRSNRWLARTFPGLAVAIWQVAATSWYRASSSSVCFCTPNGATWLPSNYKHRGQTQALHIHGISEVGMACGVRIIRIPFAPVPACCAEEVCCSSGAPGTFFYLVLVSCSNQRHTEYRYAPTICGFYLISRCCAEGLDVYTPRQWHAVRYPNENVLLPTLIHAPL